MWLKCMSHTISRKQMAVALRCKWYIGSNMNEACNQMNLDNSWLPCCHCFNTSASRGQANLSVAWRVTYCSHSCIAYYSYWNECMTMLCIWFRYSSHVNSLDDYKWSDQPRQASWLLSFLALQTHGLSSTPVFAVGVKSGICVVSLCSTMLWWSGLVRIPIMATTLSGALTKNQVKRWHKKLQAQDVPLKLVYEKSSDPTEGELLQRRWPLTHCSQTRLNLFLKWKGHIYLFCYPSFLSEEAYVALLWKTLIIVRKNRKRIWQLRTQ